ncbi:hypothetical protein ACJJTC_015967 [Scirpophaga incertulas]
MNCEACRKRITGDEVLRCTQCMKQYHFVCLNLTPAYYKANLGELRRSWMCPLCINITRRKGNNCNTPIRQQQANMDDSNMSCEDFTTIDTSAQVDRPAKNTVVNIPTASGSVTSSASITLDQFSRLLDSKLDTKLDSFQKVLTETIRKEVSDQIARLKSEFTTTTDFLAEEQKDIRTELGMATDRIRKLEDEKMQLQTSLSQINKTVQILDKSSRNCNIEIQSVPEKRSENLLQALKKLCEVINCTISESDIKSIRRVAKLNPSSDRPRNIIVSLHSELHRDTIISANFKCRNKSPHSKIVKACVLDGEVRRQVKLSSKFVHKWLDECFDSAIPPILASDNNEFSRNQVVQGPSQHNCVPAHDPIKSILLENARPSQPSNNNRVSTNMQPKSIGGYANIVSTEPNMCHETSSPNHNINTIQYMHRSGSNPPTKIISKESNNNNMSDIQLLAQAINSLSTNNVH